jgi:cytochrome P450
LLSIQEILMAIRFSPSAAGKNPYVNFLIGAALGSATAVAAKHIAANVKPATQAYAGGKAATLPKASLVETLGVFFDVALPVIAKGLILRRPAVVALAERWDLDRKAVRRLQTLRDKYQPGPLLLRMPIRQQAILLSERHVHRVLQQSPEPFATASTEKWAALSHFQPKGVLVSHQPERAVRRGINDAVLDSHRPAHRLAEQFLGVVGEETERLLATVDRHGQLSWEDFAPAWMRIVRRIVLGDGARDDEALTAMLTQLRSNANWAFLWPKQKRLRARFFARLQEHVARAEPGSLAAIAAAMETPGKDALHQVPQWLFAFDAAGMSAYRALALLTAHSEETARMRAEIAAQPDGARQDLPRLRAAVLEAVRLWPATPVILRQSTAATEWESGTMPAGAGILIFAPFFQRDDSRLPFADRFAPELWLDEQTAKDWALIPFSEGPAFCPGKNLVLLLTSAMLAALLEARQFRLTQPERLRADLPLPGTLDNYSLRFDVSGAAL